MIAEDRKRSLSRRLRLGAKGCATFRAVCRFTPVPHHRYRVGLPCAVLGNPAGLAAEPTPLAAIPLSPDS